MRLEDPLAAARREFHEETCFVAMEPFIAQVPFDRRAARS
jgi:predicted NUDIX family NTP pyrophosphohydrolase